MKDRKKRVTTIVALVWTFLHGTSAVLWGQSTEGGTFFRRTLELQQKAMSKKEMGRSLEMLWRTLDHCVTTGTKTNAVNALNNMALIHRSFGQYETALELGNRALNMSRTVAVANSEAIVLNTMATITALQDTARRQSSCANKL